MANIPGTAGPDDVEGTGQDDTINGFAGDDRLRGRGGNDTINGGDGNDRIGPGEGNDTVDGGAGIDRVGYDTTRAAATIVLDADRNPISVSTARQGQDSLTSIERLKFTDGILAFDTGAGEVAGTAYRIYQAAFDRVPDGGGLAYHINNLDSGASFTRMADIFVDSAEFKSVYGTDVSNAAFIDRLYENVLGRAGEAGGVAFWIGQLESGARTKAEVLIGFADSPENIALTGVATQNGVFFPGEFDVF